MKETVLNALLQLFAIIANVSEDGVSFKARSIVKTFLRQHLKTNLIRKYLVVFDHYLEIHHPHLFGGGISPSKRTLSDAERLKQIAEEINRSLLQREKFIVFLRLVEFINEDDVMTEKELAFIRVVADSFNISRSEHNNTKNFVLNACEEIEKDKILVIDNQDASFITGIKHFREKELEGRITFLLHASTDTLVFRYRGEMNLFLNGQHIIPDRIELLEAGSLITGSRIIPIYYSDVSRRFHQIDEIPRISFVAREIEYRFTNSNKGIRKFSFSKESGNLIGIMGGSGAGKSTLLNILSGKLKPLTGEIFINGVNIHKERSKIEGIIGFVPQDDLLIEELTVFRNLYLNARLCLANYSEKDILRKVNQVLADLDLEEIKHLKVGNPLKKFISGGQRKRLNIALELIREPAVLFVDEPTSGLSSMGSEKVMFLLKEQALMGRLVIVNIHQPHSDIYKLFDRILILDKNGHVIYKGNPIDAITYFKELSNYVNADVGHCPTCGNVMPEEILKMVEARQVDEYGRVTRERKVTPEEWYKVYRERIESKQEIKIERTRLPGINFKIPGVFGQFRIFAIRNILSKLANSQYLLVTFLEAPLLAAVIAWFTRYKAAHASYLFRGNVNLPAYLFISVIVLLFMGLMISADEIIKDRRILERESFLRLSRMAYLNSKILVLCLISAVQALTFVLVGNAILEIKGMLFPYWAILFSVACFANVLGLNVSSGLNTVVTIYIIMPFIVIPQLLFSGVLINFDRLNSLRNNPGYVPALGEMMTSKWAYEALAVHQFKGNRFTRVFYDIDRTRSNASYQADHAQLIRQILDDIHFRSEGGVVPAGLYGKLELAVNELAAMEDQKLVVSFGELRQLSATGLDETTFGSVIDSLKKVEHRFRIIKRKADKRKDVLSAKLIREWGGEKAFINRRNQYTNQQLENILLNKGQFVVEWNKRLVRKATPIYQEPRSRFGRAQLYNPEKRLGSLKMDTYWFNLIIIWFSTLVFYMTLIYDLLRKFTNWNHVRQLRKRK